ncbi:MAG: diaminopimelate decarboxylase [Saprospiraceae bacterium]|jgi:diaminopimelate decarboxylase
MEVNNDRFEFSGGVDALSLTDKYDSPLYVYDFAIIERQYKRLISAFDGVDLQINYACKANTNVNILRLIRGLGAGLDAVSIQEIRLGLHAGYQPNEILYTPNGVSMEEMDLAVEAGVQINVDNISMLEQFGQKYPDYPICIRLNPHIMAGGNSKISVGHIDSKFGISFHQMPLVKRIVEATDMVIEGLHMHTGSEILDTEVFLNGAEILLNAATDFGDLKYVDFGSGFKVPYKEHDMETDIEELGEQITKRFKRFCQEYGREITLKFEPGKYLVSEAGYFLAKVNVIKQTTSTVFAGLDSGLNHLIRPMFYDSYHQIFNLSSPSGKSRIYTVVGYICETDTFGINRKITEISEGDILAFKNAGAYCFSMSSNYNSRYRPAEILIYNGQDYLIRERETMDDLLRNQIEIETLALETVEA